VLGRTSSPTLVARYASCRRCCRGSGTTSCSVATVNLDLQLLGVGRNEHVGFNGPGSGRDSRTRGVALAERTRQDVAETFGEAASVPRTGVTMGVSDILAEWPSVPIPIAVRRRSAGDHPGLKIYVDAWR